MAEITFAAIVAQARRQAAVLGEVDITPGARTAAEFDYQLTLGPNGGWSAYQALDNALYILANEGREDDDFTVKSARAAALRARHAADIDQLIADAKAKAYTGWSNASRGPVRYAR